ncbi:carbohydrate ABC transporter permease [Paenibacillus sp. SYP-B3998]|uniref:Carbohydrate ABC transporter permease n=1 Tax=Paenibacillus sp. SYP-B3998 TaxID=2678564 RepID=A0A6G3ZWZ5_9BACL|nr:carbohydrate ABC transporter permease [Paenibacillus sp. SYP-B3998]NEW06600.1 carbohydrate ABC transporter permease [Paenibacillus sp. SYP-B3998]
MNQMKQQVEHNTPTAASTQWRSLLFKVNSNELMPPFYLWLTIVALTLFTLAPFVYLITTSFSQSKDLLSGNLIPQSLTLSNYGKLFDGKAGSDFLHAIYNSISVGFWTTGITIFVGIFASYALARLRFRLRVTVLFTILAMQLLPSISIIVPMYIMMRDGISINIPFTSIALLHTKPLLDTHFALTVAYISFSLPFAIWLMTGYFQSISKELEEASYMDGCGKLNTMFRIILPLALPGIAATAIFTFLNSWDEYMFASAFSQTYASKTLPIAVREFIGKHSIDWGLMTAGGVIASLPPVLISLFLYRYIVSGLSAGAVKE